MMLFANNAFSPFRLSLKASTGKSHGVTLIELLVALAIGSFLITAVVGTFIMILNTSEYSELKLSASSNARFALETMSTDLKALETNPGRAYFQAENNALTYGNLKDDDNDGAVDEEEPDGRDNEGTEFTDTHAQFASATSASYIERPRGIGVDDLGDVGVDEDCRFHQDRLVFRTVAPVGASYLYEDVEYSIQEFDDQPNTLVRITTRTLSGGSQENTGAAPLAFDVMSFNCLYWDSNAAADSQSWETSWDSTALGASATFLVPATVYVEIQVYADRKPVEEYSPGNDAIDVISMRTMINVENVILDSRFDRN
ncbi:MAG: PilW family protein [Candidatus Sumerlaeia bacterium]